MKDAERLFNECLDELKGTGLEPDKDVVLKVKSLSNAYGYCRPAGDHYIIEIEKKLFSDNLPDNVSKSIIMHELLHAEKGCMNHGAKWLEKVRKQESLIGYDVSGGETTGDYRIYGWRRFGIVPQNTKFIVRCKHCGMIRLFNRECSAMKDLLYGVTACPGCACQGKTKHGYELLSENEMNKWKNGTYYNEVKQIRNYYKDCSDADVMKYAKQLCPSTDCYSKSYTDLFLNGKNEEYRLVMEAIIRDGFDITGYKLNSITSNKVFTFAKGNEYFKICLPSYFGTDYPVIAQKVDGVNYMLASPTIEAAVNMIALFKKPEEYPGR